MYSDLTIKRKATGLKSLRVECQIDFLDKTFSSNTEKVQNIRIRYEILA